MSLREIQSEADAAAQSFAAGHMSVPTVVPPKAGCRSSRVPRERTAPRRTSGTPA